MSRFLRSAVLVVTLAAGLGCGPQPHTGFKITVIPPDQSKLAAGTNYKTLYVDVVTEDEAEQSKTIDITAATESPYVVVVLMEKTVHTEAKKITVALKNQGTIVKQVILSNEALKQHELTQIPIDFTQGG